MKKLVDGLSKLVNKPEKMEAEPIEAMPSEKFDAPIRAELNEEGFPALYLDQPIDVEGVQTRVEIGMDKIRFHDVATGRGKEIPKDAYENLHEEIRAELARRIAKLTPALDAEKQKLILSHTVDTLHKVAKDQTSRVRRMLAEEMSDMPDANPEAVRMLAWDEDIAVARNILEHSPLLSDAELIDLIRTSKVDGVAHAIAGRENLDEPVTGALVETENDAAILRLLENETAHLGEESMERVVEMAKTHDAWHAALCERPELTQATINRIGEFVSRELVDAMSKRGVVQGLVEEDTRLATSARLQSESVDRERDGWLRAQAAHQKGELDAEVIDDAVHAIDRYFVIPAIGFYSGIDPAIVKRILASRNPKVIMALAHQAGLSARTGSALQMKIANVPHMNMIHPRGGTDYPLSKEEMDTYLSVFVG